MKYLPTLHMPSDLLTKALAVELHRRHTVVLLGMAKLRWEQRVVETREQKEAANEAKKRAVVSAGASKHQDKKQRTR